MNDVPVHYETVEAELQRLIDALYGAGPAVIQAETDRLRALAEQIQDDRGRERALFRAGRLPELISGAPAPTSPQYAEAERLFGQGLGSRLPAADQIAELQAIRVRIGELAAEAPAAESSAIRRLSSSLGTAIEELRRSGS